MDDNLNLLDENLLISEPPLQVLPSLANKIGLNEALVLQQAHYWLIRSKNSYDGYLWIYNSYPKWNKQFPFWSNSTVKRTIKNLEKQGLLITANFNKAGFDKTKWYRIDYQQLRSKTFTQNEPTMKTTMKAMRSKRANGVGQNDQTMRSKRTNGVGQNDQTNTNRLPENTTIDYTDNNKGLSSLFSKYQSLNQSDPSQGIKTQTMNWANKLIEAGSTESEELIIKAMEISHEQGKHNTEFWKVTVGILNNWLHEETLSIDQVEKLNQQTPRRSQKRIIEKETLPDWAKHEYQEQRSASQIDSKVSNESVEAQLGRIAS